MTELIKLKALRDRLALANDVVKAAEQFMVFCSQSAVITEAPWSQMEDAIAAYRAVKETT